MRVWEAEKLPQLRCLSCFSELRVRYWILHLKLVKRIYTHRYNIINFLLVKLLDCTAEIEATILSYNYVIYFVLNIIYILQNKIQF